MPWTEIELAYLAGLLDGEGCIGVYCSFSELGSRQKTPRPVYKIRLTITNTDKRMVQWVRDRFGGYILTRKKSGERCKKVFRWNLQSVNKAQEIMAAVRPYLIVKGEQADVVLRFPANEVCNQWTEAKTGKIRGFKRALYLETRRLNKRGTDNAVAV